MFNPHYLKKIEPESACLDSLLSLPFIKESMLSELQEEFPKFMALVDGISPEYSVLNFWRDNTATLPKWSETDKNIMLIQASSAAAERVFSLLNNSFGDQQLSSLEDYLEASLMLQYNY